MTRRDEYLDPYRRSAQAHGSNWPVTLWASPQSQRIRFDVFTQMCFLAGKRILDAGCSRGDFAAYLVEQRIPFESYVGIDALPNVIDFANGRQLPGCRFHCGDLICDPAMFRIGEPQIICISGTLNTMQDEHVYRVLESAWDATSDALMFNFLSDRTGRDAVPQDDYSRRLDTMKLLDWTFGKIWHVAFRQDYFSAGHDATILMRKS